MDQAGDMQQDTWRTKFRREMGIRSAIVLSGNVNDLVQKEAATSYETVLESVTSMLRGAYNRVVVWDPALGIDHSMSGQIPQIDEPQLSGSDYPLDEGDLSELTQDTEQSYKELDEFFNYMLQVIQSGGETTAFVLDYSDLVFGNPNALSEKERHYLARLRKALEKSKSYNLSRMNAVENQNLVVLMAKNTGAIPPILYLDDPLVKSIQVPLPGRNEREAFVFANAARFKIQENVINEPVNMADFVDTLDGLTVREIAQIAQLSQTRQGDMPAAQLVNLYRYGQEISPWQELSRDKLETIQERLEKRVKGQSSAIAKVRQAVVRAYTGFSGLQHSAKQRKPKGTLFFVGPTGVGKTELAKSLAEFVFGDETACIRFDMSEYNHEHSDQRLVGAPPGYVGYEAGGQLTNAVKEKPFCVLLFDEIEKAHGKILDKFLQILEDGRLTDGKGETVSFSESIIIFTSNIGAANVSADLPPAKRRSEFRTAVREHFMNELQRPELLNRIGDNIVVFDFIDNSDILREIARSKFQTTIDFVRERYRAAIEFEDEEAIFSAIADKAGVQNGGRGLLNVIETTLVDPLSEIVFNYGDGLMMKKIVVSPPDQERRPCDFNFRVR